MLLLMLLVVVLVVLVVVLVVLVVVFLMKTWRKACKAFRSGGVQVLILRACARCRRPPLSGLMVRCFDGVVVWWLEGSLV